MHSPGIEPGSPAWQADIMPLDHECLVEICNNFFNGVFCKKRKGRRNIFVNYLLIYVDNTHCFLFSIFIYGDK
jgi:hypothetical protein